MLSRHDLIDKQLCALSKIKNKKNINTLKHLQDIQETKLPDGKFKSTDHDK